MMEDRNVVDEPHPPALRRQSDGSRKLMSGPADSAVAIDQRDRACERFDGNSVRPAQTTGTAEEAQRLATQYHTSPDSLGASQRSEPPHVEAGGGELLLSSQPKQRQLPGGGNSAFEGNSPPLSNESDTGVLTTPRPGAIRTRRQPPSAYNAPVADIQIVNVRSLAGSQAPSDAATPLGAPPSTVSPAVAHGIAAGVSQAQAAMERRMASRIQSRHASRMSRRLSPRGSFAARGSPETVRQNLVQAREALRRFEEAASAARPPEQPSSASAAHAASHRSIPRKSVSEPRVAQADQREHTQVLVAPPGAGGELSSHGEDAGPRELHVSSAKGRDGKRFSDTESRPLRGKAVSDEGGREPAVASSRRTSQGEKPARLDVLHAERVQSDMMLLAQLEEKKRASRIASRMGSRPVSRNPALLSISAVRDRADVTKAAAEELSRHIAAERLKAACLAEVTGLEAPGRQDRSPTRREQPETSSQVNRQLTPLDKKLDIVEADIMGKPRGADTESRTFFLARSFCTAPLYAHPLPSDQDDNVFSTERASGPMSSEEEEDALKATVRPGSAQNKSFLGRFLSRFFTFPSSDAAWPSVRRRRSFVPIISPSPRSPGQSSLSSSSRDSFRQAEKRDAYSPSAEDAVAGERGIECQKQSRRPVRLEKFHEQLPRKALIVTYESSERLLRLWPESDGASSASSVGTSSSGSHSRRRAGMHTSCTRGRARAWRGFSSRTRRHFTENPGRPRFSVKHQAQDSGSAGEGRPSGRGQVGVVDASASSRTSSFYSSSGWLSPRVMQGEEHRSPVSVPVLDFSWLEKIAAKRERRGLPPQPHLSRPAVQKRRVSSTELENVSARLRKQQLAIAREVSLLATRRSVIFVRRTLPRRATIGTIRQREPGQLLGVREQYPHSPASEKIFNFDRPAASFVVKGKRRTHDSVRGIKGATAGRRHSISNAAAAVGRLQRDYVTSKQRRESLSSSSSVSLEMEDGPTTEDQADAPMTPKSPLAWLRHEEHSLKGRRRIADRDSEVDRAAIYSEAPETEPVGPVPRVQYATFDKLVDQPLTSASQPSAVERSVRHDRDHPTVGRSHWEARLGHTAATTSPRISKFSSMKRCIMCTPSKKGLKKLVVEEGFRGLYIAVEPVLERFRSGNAFSGSHGDSPAGMATDEPSHVVFKASDILDRKGTAQRLLVVTEKQNPPPLTRSTPPLAPADAVRAVKRPEAESVVQRQAEVPVRRIRRAQRAAGTFCVGKTRANVTAPREHVKRSKSASLLRRVNIYDSANPRGNSVEEECVFKDRRDMKHGSLNMIMDRQNAVVQKESVTFKHMTRRLRKECEPARRESVLLRKSLTHPFAHPELAGRPRGRTRASTKRRSSGAADDNPTQQMTHEGETLMKGAREEGRVYERPGKSLWRDAHGNTSEHEQAELPPTKNAPALGERPYREAAGERSVFLRGCTYFSGTSTGLSESQAASPRIPPEAAESSSTDVDGLLSALPGGMQGMSVNEAEGSNERRPCLHAPVGGVHSGEEYMIGVVGTAVAREKQIFEVRGSIGDARGRSAVHEQAWEVSERETDARKRPQYDSSAVAHGKVCRGRRTTSRGQLAPHPPSKIAETPVASAENRMQCKQDIQVDNEGMRLAQCSVEAAAGRKDQLGATAQRIGRNSKVLTSRGAPQGAENVPHTQEAGEGRASVKGDTTTSASKRGQRIRSPSEVAKRSCEDVYPANKESEDAFKSEDSVKPHSQAHVLQRLARSKRTGAGAFANRSGRAERGEDAGRSHLVNSPKAATQQEESNASLADLTAHTGHAARESFGEHDKATDKRPLLKGEAESGQGISGGQPVREVATFDEHTRASGRKTVFKKGSMADDEHVKKAATVSLDHYSFTAAHRSKTASMWGTGGHGQARGNKGVLRRCASAGRLTFTAAPGAGPEETLESPVRTMKQKALHSSARRRGIQERAHAPEEEAQATTTRSQEATTCTRGKGSTFKTFPAARTEAVERKEDSPQIARKETHPGREDAGKGAPLEGATQVPVEIAAVHVEGEGPRDTLEAQAPDVLRNTEKCAKERNDNIQVAKPGVRVEPTTLTASLEARKPLPEAASGIGVMAVLEKHTSVEAKKRESARRTGEVQLDTRLEPRDNHHGRDESRLTKHKLPRTAESSAPVIKFAAEVVTETMSQRLHERDRADEDGEREPEDTGAPAATKTAERLFGMRPSRNVLEEADTMELPEGNDMPSTKDTKTRDSAHELKAPKLVVEECTKDALSEEHDMERLFDRGKAFVCDEQLRKSIHEEPVSAANTRKAFELRQGNEREQHVCKEERADVEADTQNVGTFPEKQAPRALGEGETVLFLRYSDSDRCRGGGAVRLPPKEKLAHVVHEKKLNFVLEENKADAASRSEDSRSLLAEHGAMAAVPEDGGRQFEVASEGALAPHEAKTLCVVEATGPTVEGKTTFPQHTKQMRKSPSEEDSDVFSRGKETAEAAPDERIGEVVFTKEDSKDAIPVPEKEVMEPGVFPHEKELKSLSDVVAAKGVFAECSIAACESLPEANATDLVSFKATPHVIPKEAPWHVPAEGRWSPLPENDVPKGVSDKELQAVVPEHKLRKILFDSNTSDIEPEKMITDSPDEKKATVSVQGNEEARDVSQEEAVDDSFGEEEREQRRQELKAGRQGEGEPVNTAVHDQKIYRRERRPQRLPQSEAIPGALAEYGQTPCGFHCTVPVRSSGDIPGELGLEVRRCDDACNVAAQGLPHAKCANDCSRDISERSSVAVANDDGGQIKTRGGAGTEADKTPRDSTAVVRQAGNFERRRGKRPRRTQEKGRYIEFKRGEFVARRQSSEPLVRRGEPEHAKGAGRSVKMKELTGRGRKEAAGNGETCGRRVEKILPRPQPRRPLRRTFFAGEEERIKDVRDIWPETAAEQTSATSEERSTSRGSEGKCEVFFTSRPEDTSKGTGRACEGTEASYRRSASPDDAAGLPGPTTQAKDKEHFTPCKAVVLAALSTASKKDEEASGVSAEESTSFLSSYMAIKSSVETNEEPPIATAFAQTHVCSGQVVLEVAQVIALQAGSVKSETRPSEQQQASGCINVRSPHTVKVHQNASAVGSSSRGHSDRTHAAPQDVPSAPGVPRQTAYELESRKTENARSSSPRVGGGEDVSLTGGDTIQLAEPRGLVATKRKGVAWTQVFSPLAEAVSMRAAEKTASSEFATTEKDPFLKNSAVTSPPYMIESSLALGLPFKEVARGVQIAAQGQEAQFNNEVGKPLTSVAVPDDGPPSAVSRSRVGPREVGVSEGAFDEKVSERREGQDAISTVVFFAIPAEEKGSAVIPGERTKILARRLHHPHTPEHTVEAERIRDREAVSHATRELSSDRDAQITSTLHSELVADDRNTGLFVEVPCRAPHGSKTSADERKLEQWQSVEGAAAQQTIRRADTKKDAAGTTGDTCGGAEPCLSSDTLEGQVYMRLPVKGDGRGDEEQGWTESSLLPSDGKKRRAVQFLETFPNSSNLTTVPSAAEKGTPKQPIRRSVASELKVASTSVQDLGSITSDVSRQQPAEVESLFSSSMRTDSKVKDSNPGQVDAKQGEDLKTIVSQLRTVGCGATASTPRALVVGTRKHIERVLPTCDVESPENSAQVGDAVEHEDSGILRNTSASERPSGLSCVRNVAGPGQENLTKHENLAGLRTRSLREYKLDTLETWNAGDGDEQKPPRITELCVGEKLVGGTKAVVDEPAEGAQGRLLLRADRGGIPAPIHCSVVDTKTATGERVDREKAVSTEEQKKGQQLVPSEVEGSLSSTLPKKEPILEDPSVRLCASAGLEVTPRGAEGTWVASDAAVPDGVSTAEGLAARGRHPVQQASLRTMKNSCGGPRAQPKVIGAQEVFYSSEALTAASASKLSALTPLGIGDRGPGVKREFPCGETTRTPAPPVSYSSSGSGAGEVVHSSAAAFVQCNRTADATSAVPSDAAASQVSKETRSASTLTRVFQAVASNRKSGETAESASSVLKPAISFNCDLSQVPVTGPEEKAATYGTSRLGRVTVPGWSPANASSTLTETDIGMLEYGRAAALPVASVVEEGRSPKSPSQAQGCAPVASTGPRSSVSAEKAGSTVVPLSTGSTPSGFPAYAEKTTISNAAFPAAGERKAPDVPAEKAGSTAVLFSTESAPTGVAKTEHLSTTLSAEAERNIFVVPEMASAGLSAAGEREARGVFAAEDGSTMVPLLTESAPTNYAADFKKTEIPYVAFSAGGEREAAHSSEHSNAALSAAGESEADTETRLCCRGPSLKDVKRRHSGLAVVQTGDEMDRWDSTVCPSPPFSPRYFPPASPPSRPRVPPLNLYWLRSSHSKQLQRKRLTELMKNLHAGLCSVNPPQIAAVTLPADTRLPSHDDLDRKKADIVASLFDDAVDLDIQGRNHQPPTTSEGQLPPYLYSAGTPMLNTMLRDSQERLLDLEKSPELKAPRGEHPPILHWWEPAARLPLLEGTAYPCPVTTSDAVTSVRGGNERTKPLPRAGGSEGTERKIVESFVGARRKRNEAEPERIVESLRLHEALSTGDRQVVEAGEVGTLSDADGTALGRGGATSNAVSKGLAPHGSTRMAFLYSETRPPKKEDRRPPSLLPLDPNGGDEAAMAENPVKLLEDSYGSTSTQRPARVPRAATFLLNNTRIARSSVERRVPEGTKCFQHCRENTVADDLNPSSAERSKKCVPEEARLPPTLREIPKHKLLSLTEENYQGGTGKAPWVAHESSSLALSSPIISANIGKEFDASEAAVSLSPRSAADDTRPTPSTLGRRALPGLSQRTKEHMPCPDDGTPVHGRILNGKPRAETETAETSESRRKSAEGSAVNEGGLANVRCVGAKRYEAIKEASSPLDVNLESSRRSATRADPQSSAAKPLSSRVKSHAPSENICTLKKSATMLLRTNQGMRTASTGVADTGIGTWRYTKQQELLVCDDGALKLDDTRLRVRPAPAADLQNFESNDDVEGDSGVGASISRGLRRGEEGRRRTQETVSKRVGARACLYRVGGAGFPAASRPPRSGTSHSAAAASAEALYSENRAEPAGPTLHSLKRTSQKDSVVAARIRSFEQMARRGQTGRSSSMTSTGIAASVRQKDRAARSVPTRKEYIEGSSSGASVSDSVLQSGGSFMGKLHPPEVTSAATTRTLQAEIEEASQHGGSTLISQSSLDSGPEGKIRHISSTSADVPIRGARRAAAGMKFAHSLAGGDPTDNRGHFEEPHEAKGDLKLPENIWLRSQRMAGSALLEADGLKSTVALVPRLSAESEFCFPGLTTAAGPKRRSEKSPLGNQTNARGGAITQTKQRARRSTATVARPEGQEGSSGTSGDGVGDSGIEDERSQSLQQDVGAAGRPLTANQVTAAPSHPNTGNTTAGRRPVRALLTARFPGVSSLSWSREFPHTGRHEERETCVASEDVGDTATQTRTEHSLPLVAQRDPTSPQSCVQRDVCGSVTTDRNMQATHTLALSTISQGTLDESAKCGGVCRPAHTDTSGTRATSSLKGLACADKAKHLVSGMDASKQDAKAESDKGTLGKIEHAAVSPSASPSRKANATGQWKQVIAPDNESGEFFPVVARPLDRIRSQKALRTHTEILLANAARLKETASSFRAYTKTVADQGSGSAREITSVGSSTRDAETSRFLTRGRDGDTSVNTEAMEVPGARRRDDHKTSRSFCGWTAAYSRKKKGVQTSFADASDSSVNAFATETAEMQRSNRLSVKWRPTNLRKAPAGGAAAYTTRAKRRASHQVEFPKLHKPESPDTLLGKTGRTMARSCLSDSAARREPSHEKPQGSVEEAKAVFLQSWWKAVTVRKWMHAAICVRNFESSTSSCSSPGRAHAPECGVPTNDDFSPYITTAEHVAHPKAAPREHFSAGYAAPRGCVVPLSRRKSFADIFFHVLEAEFREKRAKSSSTACGTLPPSLFVGRIQSEPGYVVEAQRCLYNINISKTTREWRGEPLCRRGAGQQGTMPQPEVLRKELAQPSSSCSLGWYGNWRHFKGHQLLQHPAAGSVDAETCVQPTGVRTGNSGADEDGRFTDEESVDHCQRDSASIVRNGVREGCRSGRRNQQQKEELEYAGSPGGRYAAEAHEADDINLRESQENGKRAERFGGGTRKDADKDTFISRCRALVPAADVPQRGQLNSQGTTMRSKKYRRKTLSRDTDICKQPECPRADTEAQDLNGQERCRQVKEIRLTREHKDKQLRQSRNGLLIRVTNSGGGDGEPARWTEQEMRESADGEGRTDQAFARERKIGRGRSTQTECSRCELERRKTKKPQLWDCPHEGARSITDDEVTVHEHVTDVLPCEAKDSCGEIKGDSCPEELEALGRQSEGDGSELKQVEESERREEVFGASRDFPGSEMYRQCFFSETEEDRELMQAENTAKEMEWRASPILQMQLGSCSGSSRCRTDEGKATPLYGCQHAWKEKSVRPPQVIQDAVYSSPRCARRGNATPSTKNGGQSISRCTSKVVHEGDQESSFMRASGITLPAAKDTEQHSTCAGGDAVDHNKEDSVQTEDGTGKQKGIGSSSEIHEVTTGGRENEKGDSCDSGQISTELECARSQGDHCGPTTASASVAGREQAFSSWDETSNAAEVDRASCLAVKDGPPSDARDGRRNGPAQAHEECRSVALRSSLEERARAESHASLQSCSSMVNSPHGADEIFLSALEADDEEDTFVQIIGAKKASLV